MIVVHIFCAGVCIVGDGRGVGCICEHMWLHEVEFMHPICLVMMTSLISVSEGLEERGGRGNERE